VIKFSKVNVKPTGNANQRQRINEKVFHLLYLAYYFSDFTFSQAARRISQLTGIPVSTVKWYLRKLRDMGLIICGNKNYPYIPIKVSKKGKILLGVDNID